MALGEFFGCAYIEDIGGSMGFRQPLFDGLSVHPSNAGAKQQSQCRGCGFAAIVVADVAKALAGAFDQVQARQCPTDGAIAQSTHGVGDAGIDEGLRANDAARATGTVDDDAGGRTGGERTCAKHQFAAWHADRAWNAHGLVFIKATCIKHHHIGLSVEQSFDFMG